MGIRHLRSDAMAARLKCARATEDRNEILRETAHLKRDIARLQRASKRRRRRKEQNALNLAEWREWTAEQIIEWLCALKIEVPHRAEMSPPPMAFNEKVMSAQCPI